MQSESDPKTTLLEELSEMTIKAFKELESAKRDLNEKELQLLELADSSSQKIRQAAQTNKELKASRVYG